MSISPLGQKRSSRRRSTSGKASRIEAFALCLYCRYWGQVYRCIVSQLCVCSLQYLFALPFWLSPGGSLYRGGHRRGDWGAGPVGLQGEGGTLPVGVMADKEGRT
jgi:hypothetical protein